jgi:hypothetical protein
VSTWSKAKFAEARSRWFQTLDEFYDVRARIS